MPNDASKTMQHQHLLNTRELSCVRGENTLFEKLNMDVSEGQCVHIVGENGSGKTSLLRILCGLNKPENGQILWCDDSINLSDQLAKELIYVGHKDGLKNELTAIENLAFQQRLECHYDEDLLDDALAKLKILHCADLAAQALSFGQRRRLAFARLLLSPKKIWVLDEPFTGIDVSGRTLIEQLCVEHLKRKGAIVLSHHQSLQASPLNHFTTELLIESFRPQKESEQTKARKEILGVGS